MAPAPDFTGYATRNGLKCADGRIIMAGAFKGNHGQKVPLLWQHGHNDPDNVLGHTILTNVNDGVRVDAYFNDNPKSQRAKQLVQHEDITALSIYANQLVQKGEHVHHGNIREVSLVISGANPGALIDPVTIRHGDDEVELTDEAIIYTGLTIEHAANVAAAMPEPKSDTKGTKPTAENPDPDGDGDNDLFDPADGGLGPDATIADVFNTFTPEQKQVTYALIGAALDNQNGSAAHSGLEGTGDNNEGALVPRNVFDQTDQNSGQAPASTGYTLTHADVKGIVAAGVKKGSLKAAAEDFALEHGIDSIDVMFPEVKLLTNEPDFQSRRMEWVQGVLDATRKSPFSRVKTILADITPDEARAKGYIKGNMKNEEFFGVTKRTTTPTTVYKKQKLDRDDILDITDFDVVAWMKGEMRLMLDEEVARAILIGDGRDISSADKIKDPAGASDGAGIRSVLHDHEIYTTTINVNIDDANSNADEIVDAVVAGMRFYRGTGQPVFYTTLPVLTKLLLAKDTLGRRLYPTKADLAAAMMVRDIQSVEPMEEETSLLGLVVNLADYNIGADSGGQVSLFDFFDIDFNQQKYLIETRMSGALVKFKAALAVMKVDSADVLVDPLVPPTQSGNTVSGANQTHVTYVATGAAGAVTISGGSFTLTPSNTPVTVQASPASGYFFASNAEDSWTFEYQP
jgi:HK97 family phage prohead protease